MCAYDNAYELQIVALLLYTLRYGLDFSQPLLTPTRLVDYILLVAEGYGAAHEQKVWLLCQEYGLSIHTINHARRQVLQRLIKAYNYRVPLMVVLYGVLIWLLLGPVAPYNECGGGLDHHCMIKPSQRWHAFSDPSIDYYRHLPQPLDQALPHQYRDLVTGDLYVTYRMVDGSMRWLRPRDLANQLASLSEECVCPVMMGIAGNMTFLRYRYRENDRREWLVMHRPFIYRNNTMSNLVESSILYYDTSPFYENYLNFLSSTAMKPRHIHYETLHVEYTEVAFFDDLSRPSTTTPVDHSLDSGGLVLDARPEKEASVQQRRITLTQADAICFYFCDTTNRAVSGLVGD